MYRRQSSHGQGRRSSGPKRLSAVEDRSSKKVSDGKKSFIPRPTVSVRSSSVERDEARSAARVTSGIPRSASSECINVEDYRRTSDFRGRYNENLITPNHVLKTPGTNVHRTTVSVQRTVRKDTRSLTDKGFQITELAKVQEYLVTKKIIPNEGQDLCNSMTLKLFVRIMNSVLMELIPSQTLTLSNYAELIPLLMRKLKYPGHITRSLLVTANSSHTWPNVLGLLSWLIFFLNFESLNTKFVVECEDNLLDNDRVTKLFTYTRQQYIEWSENNTAFGNEEDVQFFDDLVVDLKNPLEKDLSEVKKEVQDLLRQTESPEEKTAEQKFKIVKTELEKKKSARTGPKERLHNMQIAFEKKNNETQLLINENINITECITDNNCSNSYKDEDMLKFQSEGVSLRNIIKLQDTHITDISNRCYASDLTIAGLQGKLDKVHLQRDALLRKCASEFVDGSQLQLALNYGNEDNSRIVSEYLTHVKELRDTLEILKEYSENEKINKIYTNEAKEKFKFCKSEIAKREAELQQSDKELMMKRSFADLECQLSVLNEQYSKIKEKNISSESALKLKRDMQLNSEKELKDQKDSFIEQRKKCSRILARMGIELRNHVKRCHESYSIEELFK